MELTDYTNLLQCLFQDVKDLGAQLSIFKGSITSLNTTLYYIANRFNKAELIGNTLTPIVPLVPLADPPSHPKLLSGDITSSNTFRNQKYDSTAAIAHFSLIRENLSNSFSLAGFNISIQ